MTQHAVVRALSPYRDGVRRATVGAAPFHDWVGEAMIQENIVLGPRLEGLAGLDATRWRVVGISIVPACGHSTTDEIHIDAVDLASIGLDNDVSGFHQLIALVDRYSALPVTRVHLRGLGLRDLLGYMTRGRLCLQATGIVGAQLNVVEHTVCNVGSALESQ